MNKDIRKAALIACRRVMNHDDAHEEAIFSAGFEAGVSWQIDKMPDASLVESAKRIMGRYIFDLNQILTALDESTHAARTVILDMLPKDKRK